MCRSFSTRETSGFWPKFSTSFSDWWWLEHGWIMTFHILRISSSQLTNFSYFSEWLKFPHLFVCLAYTQLLPPNVPGVELDPCRTPAEQGPSFTFAAVRGPVALSGTHSFVENVGLILGKAQVRTSYLWIKPTKVTEKNRDITYLGFVGWTMSHQVWFNAKRCGIWCGFSLRIWWYCRLRIVLGCACHSERKIPIHHSFPGYFFCIYSWLQLGMVLWCPMVISHFSTGMQPCLLSRWTRDN